MSIKGLTDRNLSFPEIGQVRKGAKKNEKGELGRDLTYFRVEFDEKEQEASSKFNQVYGEQPQEINILLPFDEINRCWDAWLEAYTAGRMIARADGEKFIYWIDTATGKNKVKDGEPYTKYTEGQIVGTYVDGKGKVQNVTCDPVGRLKVVIPELQRLAYLTVMTSSLHDIANISAQLEALKSVNGGRIAGIPMVLRRRPKKISTPKPDGTRARYTKWMLSIEADPQWVKAKLIEVKHAALPGNGLNLLPDTIDAQFKDDAPEVGEPDEEIQDDEYQEDEERIIPSEPAMNTDYDVDLKTPEQVKSTLIVLVSEIVQEKKTEPVKDGQKGVILSCLQWIMAPGDATMKRHAFLKYVFDVSSSKDLTDPQWRALGRYLKPQRQDTGEYKPEDPITTKEIGNLIAFLDSNNGQQTLI